MNKLRIESMGLDFAKYISVYPIKKVDANFNKTSIDESNNTITLIDEIGKLSSVFSNQIGSHIKVYDDISNIFEGIISNVDHNNNITTITVKTELEQRLAEKADISLFNTSAESVLNAIFNTSFKTSNYRFNVYADDEDNLTNRTIVSTIQQASSIMIYYDYNRLNIADYNSIKLAIDYEPLTLVDVVVKQKYTKYDSYSINYIESPISAFKTGDNTLSLKLDATSNIQLLKEEDAHDIGLTKIRLSNDVYSVKLDARYNQVNIKSLVSFKLDNTIKKGEVISYTRDNYNITAEVLIHV